MSDTCVQIRISAKSKLYRTKINHKLDIGLGDLVMVDGTEEVHIIALVRERGYNLISLEDGNRYCNEYMTVSDLIDDNELVRINLDNL